MYYKIQGLFVACRLYAEGCGCWNRKSVTGNAAQLTFPNEILFSLNVGVVMSPNGRKSKGVLSKVWCSSVRPKYKQAVRQITRTPLPYIHTNEWLSNVTKQHADNLPCYCAQNLWCGHICCTVNTLIDVKFPEGSFESQQFAAADGRTRSLRLVRPVTFPFEKDILISLYSFLPEIWNTNS